MKKFLKAVKLFGIAATASFAVIAVVYFFETRTVAGNSEYKAVAVDYTEAASVKETEAATTVKTVEETKTETVKETVKEVVTEEVTEAQTEPATVKATEPQTAAPAVKVEPQTAAPAAPAVKAELQTAAPAAAPAAQTSLTNVVYKDTEGSHNYATLDEAKTSIKVAILSDSEAKAAAKANKTAYASQASEVVNLINEYRTANGLAKLSVNDTLSTAAMHRAAESAYADWNMTAMEGGAKRHIRPNFTKASTIASEYGIGGNFGENFGRWQASPSEIVAQWKSSSSHNALLLSGSYTKVGIGVAQDSLGYYYWVALFN